MVSNIDRNFSWSLGEIDVALFSGLAEVAEPLNLFSILLAAGGACEAGFLTAGFLTAAFFATVFLMAVGLGLVFVLEAVGFDLAAVRRADGVFAAFFLVALFLADLSFTAAFELALFFAPPADFAADFAADFVFFFGVTRTELDDRFLVAEARVADLAILVERFLGLKGFYPVNLGGMNCGIVGKSINCVKLDLLLLGKRKRVKLDFSDKTPSSAMKAPDPSILFYFGVQHAQSRADIRQLPGAI